MALKIADKLFFALTLDVVENVPGNIIIETLDCLCKAKKDNFQIS